MTARDSFLFTGQKYGLTDGNYHPTPHRVVFNGTFDIIYTQQIPTESRLIINSTIAAKQ